MATPEPAVHVNHCWTVLVHILVQGPVLVYRLFSYILVHILSIRAHRLEPRMRNRATLYAHKASVSTTMLCNHSQPADFGSPCRHVKCHLRTTRCSYHPPCCPIQFPPPMLRHGGRPTTSPKHHIRPEAQGRLKPRYPSSARLEHFLESSSRDQRRDQFQ